MQASIDANDEKMKKIYYEFTDMKSEMTDIKTYLKHVLVQNQNSSPDHMDSLKDQDINYEVPDNKKAPPLEGRNPKKMVACGLSNMRSSHQNSMNSSSIHNSSKHFYGHQELLQPHKICV